MVKTSTANEGGHMPTPEQINYVTIRGRRIRDEIADVLAKARGPTSLDDLRERLPMIDSQEMGFQLGRMEDEKKIVKNGDGFTLDARAARAAKGRASLV
jgi:hypothetical protein